MNHNLLLAILTGLGGMLGWGFADFFAKKTIDKIGDLAALFWSQLIGLIPLLLLFLLHPVIPLFKASDWLVLLVLGLIEALSWVITYRGFEKGNISILSPVFASYAAFAVLFSVWLFHEPISTYQQGAIIIVLAGIILISTNPLEIVKLLRRRTKNTTKGLPEALSSSVIYALWFVLFDHFISDRSWVFILFSIRATVAFTVFVTTRIKRESLKVPAEHKSITKFLWLLGLSDVAAYAVVAYGFSATTYTSIITVLTGAFSLPTIILARIYMKEKITPLQMLAALIIIAGIATISLS